MRTLATKQPTHDSAKQKKNRRRSHSVSPLSTGIPLLQRKCACGGGCPRCQAEQDLEEALSIQTKLNISQPGDKYEQEADRVAEQVMRMPEPTVSESETTTQVGEKTLQTKSVLPQSTTDSLTVSPSIIALQGGGQPLSQSERAFFEPRFRADFSQVRIHADNRAAEMAQSMNARAFTIGQDIVFGSGRYQSETREGHWLLAHELTHVEQQNRIGVRIQPLFGGCGRVGDPLELGHEPERLIAQNHNLGQEIEIPRASKGSRRNDYPYVGTTCPPRSRPRGFGDIFFYQRPYLYMAEIKPADNLYDIVEAQEQYAHYDLRIRELTDRFPGGGVLCTDEIQQTETEDWDFDLLIDRTETEDRDFDRIYCNNDISNGFEVEVTPMPYFIIPHEPSSAGPFNSEFELFYNNEGDGAVLYWCEPLQEEEPTDEEPPEEEPPQETPPTEETPYLERPPVPRGSLPAPAGESRPRLPESERPTPRITAGEPRPALPAPEHRAPAPSSGASLREAYASSTRIEQVAEETRRLERDAAEVIERRLVTVPATETAQGRIQRFLQRRLPGIITERLLRLAASRSARRAVSFIPVGGWVISGIDIYNGVLDITRGRVGRGLAGISCGTADIAADVLHGGNVVTGVGGTLASLGAQGGLVACQVAIEVSRVQERLEGLSREIARTGRLPGEARLRDHYELDDQAIQELQESFAEETEQEEQEE